MRQKQRMEFGLGNIDKKAEYVLNLDADEATDTVNWKTHLGQSNHNFHKYKI